ncbi:MAG: ATP-binding protein [Opitutales bacterium]
MSASLALVGYISYWGQLDALRQLEQTARTNTKFIEELQLPYSTAMAEKLSTVLGLWAGFYHAASENPRFTDASWPDNFYTALEEAIKEGPSTFHFEGHDVAIAAFENDPRQLVLIRESRSVLATGLGDAVLVPSIILTIACLGLAYYLARRIVNPLTTLTDWLPNLEREDQPLSIIPTTITSRGDELGTLARALEDTHQRLHHEKTRRRQSERMATLGRIATSLAHEIRNPAASIGLHAELLARSPNLKDSESIGFIRTEVNRINDLVNQWLFVVRPAPPKTGRHKLAELVAHTSASMSAAMEHAGAKLQLNKATEPLHVDCDRSRIEQVIRNLLANAAQAMPQGGKIRIDFECRENEAVVTIQDSGHGFSDDALERFGEAFFSEREGGMGIGLTLAREVVEAHGGKLLAANTPSGGAEVRVQLPLSKTKSRAPS